MQMLGTMLQQSSLNQINNTQECKRESATLGLSHIHSLTFSVGFNITN